MNNLVIHCVRASTSRHPDLISSIYNSLTEEKVGKINKDHLLVDSDIYCNRLREHFYNTTDGSLDFLFMQVMMVYMQKYTTTMIIKDI